MGADSSALEALESLERAERSSAEATVERPDAEPATTTVTTDREAD